METLLVIASQYNVVQLTKEICMDTRNDLPFPGPEEYAKCSALVAKVMIQNDHVYSAEEIETARGAAPVPVAYQCGRLPGCDCRDWCST
jgi:hypothetical protein